MTKYKKWMRPGIARKHISLALTEYVSEYFGNIVDDNVICWDFLFTHLICLKIMKCRAYNIRRCVTVETGLPTSSYLYSRISVCSCSHRHLVSDCSALLWVKRTESKPSESQTHVNLGFFFSVLRFPVFIYNCSVVSHLNLLLPGVSTDRLCLVIKCDDWPGYIYFMMERL